MKQPATSEKKKLEAATLDLHPFAYMLSCCSPQGPGVLVRPRHHSSLSHQIIPRQEHVQFAMVSSVTYRDRSHFSWYIFCHELRLLCFYLLCSSTCDAFCYNTASSSKCASLSLSSDLPKKAILCCILRFFLQGSARHAVQIQSFFHDVLPTQYAWTSLANQADSIMSCSSSFRFLFRLVIMITFLIFLSDFFFYFLFLFFFSRESLQYHLSNSHYIFSPSSFPLLSYPAHDLHAHPVQYCFLFVFNINALLCAIFFFFLCPLFPFPSTCQPAFLTGQLAAA